MYALSYLFIHRSLAIRLGDSLQLMNTISAAAGKLLDLTLPSTSALRCLLAAAEAVSDLPAVVCRCICISKPISNPALTNEWLTLSLSWDYLLSCDAGAPLCVLSVRGHVTAVHLARIIHMLA